MDGWNPPFFPQRKLLGTLPDYHEDLALLRFTEGT
jgi:hypothetical protein